LINIFKSIRKNKNNINYQTEKTDYTFYLIIKILMEYR